MEPGVESDPVMAPFTLSKIGRDPETLVEWQEAADAAEFMLALDSAVQYGLLTVDGKPESNVDVRRCEWILEEARKRGIQPEKNWAL